MNERELHDKLFFYVEGSDLNDEVATLLRERFKHFVEGRTWLAADVWFVDQIDEDDPTLTPGELPDWDLGFNMMLVNPPEARPTNWFDDIAASVAFLQALSAETNRSFVIGGSLAGWASEDLFYVDAESVDLEEMKFHLGGTTTESPRPRITLSESAAKAFREAANTNEYPRIEIGPGFQVELWIDRKSSGDVAVEASGVTFLLDAGSAHRADGISIDFVDGAFKIENPNKPLAT